MLAIHVILYIVYVYVCIVTNFSDLHQFFVFVRINLVILFN